MTAGSEAYEHWEPHDGAAALRNQITQTRADLGDTITELAARADVKARAREAVAQARTRARETVRLTARSAAVSTRDAARSGATSARQVLDRVMRSPASVAVGAGAGALAGLGVYALVRRRLPFGDRFVLASPRLAMGRAARSWRRSRAMGQGRRR